MSEKTSKRWLIRAAYLMPALTLLCQLIWGLIPHLYFVYQDRAHETLSLFALLSNTGRKCLDMMERTGLESGAKTFFTWMLVYTVVAWIALVLFAVFAILSAVMSLRAFSAPPTHRTANRSKRWLHLFCPNRAAYGVLCLLPPILGFFPTVLSAASDKYLWMHMPVHYMGPSDWLLALVLSCISIGLFFGTLSLQDASRMDMFRLYKKKNDKE